MADMRAVRNYCQEMARPLWDDFEARRQLWLSIARHFYPAGVRSLRDAVDSESRERPDTTSILLTLLPVKLLAKGAAGFQTNITSPARSWFELGLKGVDDPGSSQGVHEALQFLDALSKSVSTILRESGFYTESHKLYTHLLAFNVGCMLLLEDKRTVIRPLTLPPGTYALGVGADGLVDRVVRRFAMTRNQLLEEFGAEAVPEDIKRLKPSSTRKWIVSCLIEPHNLPGDKIRKHLILDDQFAYRAIYWLENYSKDATAGVLRQSGFLFNPIVAPRWTSETGDTYGCGCGELALPTARGMQTLREDALLISGMRAAPPVVASADLEARGLNLGREGVNWAKFGQQQGEMVYPVFRTPPDSAETRNDFEEMRQELAQAFFIDAFTTIDNLKYQKGVKTAFEIDQLVRENMEQLGPIVTSLDRALLDPVVTTTAFYAIVGGHVDFAFSDGQAVDLQALAQYGQIKYVSPVHLAQRAREQESSQAWLSFLGSIAQFNPEVLDTVDTDAVAVTSARMMGVPEKYMRGADAVAQIRQSRAAAQQAQMEAERAAQTAKVLADVAKAPIDREHAGGALMNAMGGGQ